MPLVTLEIDMDYRVKIIDWLKVPPRVCKQLEKMNLHSLSSGPTAVDD